MVHYKLVYFNARGKAELARLIFAVAGQDYEDFRFDIKDWPTTYKPNAPFGQAPYLEIEDGDTKLTLAQSSAIARYLARKYNMVGQSELEHAEIDMYADQIADCVAEMAKFKRETDEARKTLLHNQFFNEVLPVNLKLIEAKLAKSTSGYFIGSTLSWVDLYLFTVLEWLNEKKDASIENFKAIREHNDKIKSLPKIAEWLAKRPVTEF